MAAIVVDSSIGACWAMPDEFSAIANQALDALADAEMLVPSLFWYELANVLVVNERRGRIDKERTGVAIEKILTLPYQTRELGADLPTVMDLARAYNLTVYDATYLELAKQAGARLATLDKRMRAAAAAEEVELITEAG